MRRFLKQEVKINLARKDIFRKDFDIYYSHKYRNLHKKQTHTYNHNYIHAYIHIYVHAYIHIYMGWPMGSK